jgi:hypothetical protein
VLLTVYCVVFGGVNENVLLTVYCGVFGGVNSVRSWLALRCSAALFLEA